MHSASITAAYCIKLWGVTGLLLQSDALYPTGIACAMQAFYTLPSTQGCLAAKSFGGFGRRFRVTAFAGSRSIAYYVLICFNKSYAMTTRANEWPDLGRFWTVPNALSLLRLVLVLPITWLIWQDGPLEWVVGLVLVAILTDWFDGRLARWLGTVSEWGKVLDPMADKAAGGLAVLALTFRASEPNLPVWFLALVLARDGAILAGSAVLARRVGKVVMSAWLGKAATTWLAITVLAALLRADAPVLDVCVYMTAGLLVVSFVVYTWHFIRTAQTPAGQKKVYQMDLSSTRGHPNPSDPPSQDSPSQDSSSQDDSNPSGALPSEEHARDTETQARSGTSSPNTS